jgi:hypothetical protein
VEEEGEADRSLRGDVVCTRHHTDALHDEMGGSMSSFRVRRAMDKDLLKLALRASSKPRGPHRTSQQPLVNTQRSAWCRSVERSHAPVGLERSEWADRDFRRSPEKEEVVMTDSWMTWAARPEELGPPVGLVRKTPMCREGSWSDAMWSDVPTQNEIEDERRKLSETDPTTEHGLRKSLAHELDETRSRHRSRRARNLRLAPRTWSILAALGLAGSSILALPACHTAPAIVVNAAVVACIEIIKALFDTPQNELPAGYAPCGQIAWPVQNHEFKFCLFCDPTKPQEIFVQFDCQGKFYPMRLRRIARVPGTPVNGSIDELTNEYLSIEKITCDEMLLIDAATTVAPFMSALDCTLRAPNARIMPSIAHYGTLDVRIDGVSAPRQGDFEIASGAVLDFTGSFEEVAHYAMTCGIRELSFKDGSHAWTVHANPEVSAIAVFRDNELQDARFLFAPQPGGDIGG